MLNLRDNKIFNKTIEGIMYHGGMHQDGDWNITTADLKNKEYIEQNRDTIIRAMAYQWFKQRFVKTVSDEVIADGVGAGWLQKITDAGDVKWIQNALNNGESVYDFVPERFTGVVVDKITSIRDFFYSACDAYLNKVLSNGKVNVTLSYLTTVEKYNTYDNVYQQATKWYDKQQKIASEQRRKKLASEKMRQGAELFMSLPNGYNIWQLKTVEALDAESDVMGHCVGQGGYDAGVKAGTTKIYSLRDADDTPHATIEVDRNNNIRQCRGTANTKPTRKYVPYIQEFVTKTGYTPIGDLKNMGLCRDVNGKCWSIYNLPENLTVDELDLRATDGVKIPAGLKCENLYLSFATNITLPPDLQVDELYLGGTDGVKIPDGFKCKKLSFGDDKNFTLPQDLQVTDELDLDGTDGVKIPDGFKCKRLDLYNAKNFVIPASAEIGEIVGANEFIVKKYKLEHAKYKAKQRVKDKVEEIKQKAEDKVKEIKQKIKEKLSKNTPPMGLGDGNGGR